MELLVTGLASFSPLGDDDGAIAARLRRGEHAIRATTIPGHGTPFGHAPIAFDWDAEWGRLRERDDRFARLVSSYGLLGLRVVERLLAAARFSTEDCDLERLAVVATGLTDTPAAAWDAWRADPGAFDKFHGGRYTHSSITSVMGHFLGVRGPAFNVNMACASGGAALLCAAMLLESGRADAAIVVATNLRSENPLMHQALMNLGVFSRRGALAYAAADRDGTVAGDVAVALLLETPLHYRRRGASLPPRAILRAIDVSDDGASYLAPSTAPIARLLARTRDALGGVDYVNPHGAGTPAGDRVEVAAIRETLGPDVAVNSTKAYVGHAFDACFLQELHHTVLQMEGGFLAPVLHSTELDPECRGVDLVLGEARAKEVRRAICFNLGMGGVNAAAALSLP
jgi:3-oxoacyl-(acyl-carrier-protein) synthase